MLMRICCLILAVACCLPALADDDPLQPLGERYEAQQNLYRAALKQATSDAERRAAFEKLDPRNVLVEDFLAVEAAHRGEPAGVSALYQLIRGASGVADLDGPAAKGRSRAVAIAREHYREHPHLHYLFAFLVNGVIAPEAEGLLEDAIQSPHKRVRAAARFQLARFLKNQATLAEMFAPQPNALPLDDDPAAVELLNKLQQQVNKLGLDPIERRQKAARALKDLIAHDTESLRTHFAMEGPGKLQVREAEPPKDFKSKTYAELAARLLFELENLQPGCTAPDIAGEDASGRQFKLSDYRGRVVLLTFSANWCGPCKAMYPAYGKLQTDLADAPFAILAVMGDKEKRTVIQDTGSGEIRWRTWFDGDDGPIATNWNVNEWPTIYLIDHRGVIQSHVRLRSPERLRAAIDTLLTAQQSDPKAAEVVRTHPIPELPKPQASE
jgi:thiol-disulfide isomerase/thioredoxin